jgi:hypothetical protein
MPARRTECIVVNLTQEQQISVMRALGISARVLEVPLTGTKTVPFGAGAVSPTVGSRKLALTSWQKAEIRDRTRQTWDFVELVPGMSVFK